MRSAGPATLFPFSVAVLGIATYSCMDGVMKSLSLAIGAYNAILWRMLIALVFAGALFIWKRGRWPARATMHLHLKRGVVGALMAFLFFWGLVYVPLAEAIALSFIAPLIALYLAAIMLKEKIGSQAVLASAIGFSGALVIIGGKLGGEYSDNLGPGIAAILLSAMLYAYNLILQRQQALLAGPVEIAFFQNCIVLLLYALFAPFWAVAPSAELLPGLAGAAVLGFLSLLLVSWAYARAEARILIPVEYTAFIWAALIGWLVFAEDLTPATLAGTALIVVGCLVAARQRREPMDRAETPAV